MNSQTRDTLELYVEKARLLASGEFVRFAREQGLGVSIGFNGKENIFTTAQLAPSENSLLSLATTFRFFLQKNEPISFERIHELYSDLSPNLVEHCQCIIGGMNALLNVRPLNLTIDEAPISLEKIKEVFLYGELAHSTKRTIYKQWESNRFGFPLMRFFFDNAVAIVLETIFALAFLFEMELSGKHVPSRRSKLCCARLERAKDANEWGRVTTTARSLQHQRNLSQQVATSQPVPVEAGCELELSFTK